MPNPETGLQQTRNRRLQVGLDPLPRNRLEQLERWILVRLGEVHETPDHVADITFGELLSKKIEIFRQCPVAVKKEPEVDEVLATSPIGDRRQLHPRHSIRRARDWITHSGTNASGTEQARPQNATSRGGNTRAPRLSRYELRCSAPTSRNSHRISGHPPRAIALSITASGNSVQESTPSRSYSQRSCSMSPGIFTLIL